VLNIFFRIFFFFINRKFKSIYLTVLTITFDQFYKHSIKALIYFINNNEQNL